jgi:hypothetical protein
MAGHHDRAECSTPAETRTADTPRN